MKQRSADQQEPDVDRSWETQAEYSKYRGECQQQTTELRIGPPLKESEKELEELEGVFLQSLFFFFFFFFFFGFLLYGFMHFKICGHILKPITEKQYHWKAITLEEQLLKEGSLRFDS